MCFAPPRSSMIPIRARLPVSISPTFVNPSPMLSNKEFCSLTSLPMSIVNPFNLATCSDNSDMRSLFCCSIMEALASWEDKPPLLPPLRGAPPRPEEPPARPDSRLPYMSSPGRPVGRWRICCIGSPPVVLCVVAARLDLMCPRRCEPSERGSLSLSSAQSLAIFGHTDSYAYGPFLFVLNDRFLVLRQIC
jgi:hypothetical protein